MTNGPDSKNPLAPYYPSDVPDVPGNGRKWVAILVALSLLAGAAFGVVSMFLSL